MRPIPSCRPGVSLCHCSGGQWSAHALIPPPYSRRVTSCYRIQNWNDLHQLQPYFCDHRRAATGRRPCRAGILIRATIDGVSSDQVAPLEVGDAESQLQQQEVAVSPARSESRSKARSFDQEQHADVQQTAHRAAAEQIASAAGLASHEARSMWDSVSKPLLRIGKSGVSSSHLQSLSELLKAHGLVKVQLNAVHADVFAIGRQLSDGSAGSLLVGKGRTLLFGDHQATTKQLLSTAKTSHSRSADASDRKAALVEAGPPMLQLKPSAAAKLRSLFSGNVVADGEFDRHSLRCLAALPENLGMEILSACTKAKMRSVRNKSAWLTSQCRRIGSKQPNKLAVRQ